MKKKLLILGLGHLASFVCNEAESLENFEVIGSYRNLEKVQDFEVHKVFFDAQNVESLHNLPNDVDYVLLNFPVLDNYNELLKGFDKFFNKNAKFIFISSTSVFGSGICHEGSPRLGERRNGKVLIQCEDTIMAFSKRDWIIIRPGGLIDETRNPANSLSLKEELTNSQLEINLVHTRDVARFIIHCLVTEQWSTVFNLVSDYHITREAFYTQQFKKLNLSIPKWTKGDSPSRVIKSDRALESGFIFLYPTLDF
jgi:nucleoside-diphosphate-sugar epimerase